MQFDDRLKTVLMQPVADSHDRTIRWRQLTDLLSRMTASQDAALVDAALELVRSERPHISDGARAATARAIAGRSMDPRLIAIFAQDKLAIAAPLLASSSLDAAGWDMVHAEASDDVASLLNSLGRPAEPVAVDEEVVEPEVEGNSDEAMFRDPVVTAYDDHDEVAPSIGEMVARIERLRNQREPVAESFEPVIDDPEPVVENQGEAVQVVSVEETAEAKAEPEAGVHISTIPQAAAASGDSSEWPIAAEITDETRLFRWESDSSGQIAWVDGAPRGPLVGRSLTDDDDGDRALVRAVSDRAPFDGATLTLDEPVVRGEWRLSGIPAFSPQDGRFLGYRGIARKEVEVLAAAPVVKGRRSRINRDLDALRETIHEIRTPLNAIIGFAEIIDGQYLGPAHRNYRVRAAEIVGQARTLMGAIDDLDFAARTQAEMTNDRHSTNISTIMDDVRASLEQHASETGIGLTFAIDPDATIATGPALAERLIRRFLSAVIGAGEGGERFEIRIERAADHQLRIAISRPMVTVGLGEDLILDPSYVGNTGKGPTILGLGFALRMVRGLVRMIGGDIHAEPGALAVFVPEGRA